MWVDRVLGPKNLERPPSIVLDSAVIKVVVSSPGLGVFCKKSRLYFCTAIRRSKRLVGSKLTECSSVASMGVSLKLFSGATPRFLLLSWEVIKGDQRELSFLRGDS